MSTLQEVELENPCKMNYLFLLLLFNIERIHLRSNQTDLDNRYKKETWPVSNFHLSVGCVLVF